MKKIILIVLMSFMLSGCNRAFWSPNWDKAETERRQAELLERQTIALEQIAKFLGENPCKN